jgi:alpha-ketoglutarate-dependent taurine dioxygenase
MLRPTAVLFIPPPLARLLVAVGFVAFEALLKAHQQETQKLREESGVGPSHAGEVSRMDPIEALKILGLNEHLAVPLRGVADRESATANFRRFFSSAKKLDNAYLMGKLSAAYRLCVDERWDCDTETTR